MTSVPQSGFDPGRTSWREAGLWAGAGLLVLSMHAVAAGFLAGVQPPQEAAGARQEALFFEMAPLPEPSPVSVASDAPETFPRPEPEPEQRAAEAPEKPQIDTPVEPPAPIEQLAPIPDEPEAAMPTETIEQADEASKSVVELPPDSLIPLPTPRPVAKQAAAETAMRQKRERAVERTEEKAAKPAPPKAKPTAKQAAASTNPPQSKASKSRGAQSAPRVSPAKWQSKVLAWLNRHKRYPAAARARKASGSAHVGFSIDPSGRVISARSSGDADLDKAAVDMIHRASPVPAPPPEIARPRMSLTVPVVFDLN